MISSEAKAKMVVMKLCYLLLLFVSLLLTQLHSFFPDYFLYLQKKLRNYKNSAKNNAKSSAKRSLELEETEKAKNDKLRAQGVDTDANLVPDEIKAIALSLMEQIKLILKDGKVYVLASHSYRNKVDAWASASKQGNSKSLSPKIMETA